MSSILDSEGEYQLYISSIATCDINFDQGEPLGPINNVDRVRSLDDTHLLCSRQVRLLFLSAPVIFTW